jgi:putative YhdH/YhfP family quinone oxidoreductase
MSAPTSFKAYRLFGSGDRPTGRIVAMPPSELSAGDVLVRTAYAGVNYKDALAAHGINGIVRNFPRTGGIDLFGTVSSSGDPRFEAGDPVMVHGFGIGVDHDGGFAEYARVPGDWVMPLPAGLTLHEAASLGVAGYTAALSLHLMELNDVVPEGGPIAVTGATGGVASLAIAMLARRAYSVTAITRKSHERAYLELLGAAEVVGAAIHAATRPLERGLWAGALDSVGGETLGWLTRTMQPSGVIAAFGNAGGTALDTTVLPFILRGIRLIGINANSPMPLRRRVWEWIATDLKPPHLSSIVEEIGLEELPQAFDRLLGGSARGRYLVVFR